MNKVIKGWKEIPYSDACNEAIKALKEGEVLAVRMRHVNSSDSNLPKVQIEFAEKMGNRVTTAASLFNSDDNRFSSGAQRAWETASLSIAEKMFGSIPDNEASVEINKVLQPENGSHFRIQITEDVESSLNENEANYPENYLKRAGAEGEYFLTPSGERVIARKRLIHIPVGDNPVNTYLEGSYRAAGSPITNSSAISSELESATK